MFTCVPVDGVHPLHVPGHDLDARLFPAVLLEEQVVGLQVQHARGLPVVHEAAVALLPVLERVVAAIVHHQVAAGFVAGHRHQYLPLVARVVPVGLGRRGRLVGGRLPAPVHDGAVRRPDQYHALRVVRLVHQPLGRGTAGPAFAERLRHAAAVRLRQGHVGQPVRDAVVRQWRRAAGVPGRRFHEVFLRGGADGAVEQPVGRHDSAHIHRLIVCGNKLFIRYTAANN